MSRTRTRIMSAFGGLTLGAVMVLLVGWFSQKSFGIFPYSVPISIGLLLTEIRADFVFMPQILVISYYLGLGVWFGNLKTPKSKWIFVGIILVLHAIFMPIFSALFHPGPISIVR